MHKIIFEITDLIEFLLYNREATGIQRYQLCIIREISNKFPEATQVCYTLPSQNNRYVMRGADLFADSENSANKILSRIGVIKNGFPNKATVQRLLHGFGRRKIARALKKIDIYLSAIAFRKRYHIIAGIEHGLPLPVPREAIKIPAPNDILIITGVSIGLHLQHTFALAHKQAGGRVIQVIHDLIPCVHPEYFTAEHSAKLISWFNQLSTYATNFVCVSENTRSDLIKNLLIPSENTHTISLQHDFPGHPRITNDSQYLSAEPDHGSLHKSFVLCVGTLEVRKNGTHLLRAWRKVVDQLGSATPQLIFAGKRGWHIEEFEQFLANCPELEQKVTLTGSISDTDLAMLYKSCLFTVFPSLYEGWGLPIGESLWFGKLCITSNISSMPEVGGPLCDYVDPCDVDQLAAAALRAICDSDYRRTKEQAIRAAPLRSWADVALDFCSHLEHLSKTGHPTMTDRCAP